MLIHSPKNQLTLILYSYFSERKIPPSFTKKPSSQVEDSAGNMLKLEARVSGSSPINVCWRKDSTEISSSDSYDISFKSNVSVLCFKSSSLSDSGNYSCEATNEAGTATCHVSVKISGRDSTQKVACVCNLSSL